MNLKAAATDWRESLSVRGLSDLTIRNYTELSNRLPGYFDSDQSFDLSQQDVDRFIEQRKGDDWEVRPSTILKELSVLRQICCYAGGPRWVPNWLMPKWKRSATMRAAGLLEAKQKRRAGAEEIAHGLLAVWDDRRARAAHLISLMTGLRETDVLALRSPSEGEGVLWGTQEAWSDCARSWSLSEASMPVFYLRYQSKTAEPWFTYAHPWIRKLFLETSPGERLCSWNSWDAATRFCQHRTRRWPHMPTWGGGWGILRRHTATWVEEADIWHDLELVAKILGHVPAQSREYKMTQRYILSDQVRLWREWLPKMQQAQQAIERRFLSGLAVAIEKAPALRGKVEDWLEVDLDVGLAITELTTGQELGTDHRIEAPTSLVRRAAG